MILVDTSVWIDHLRKGDERLAALLSGNDGLFGTDIGYIDAHLIASVRTRNDTRLWTRDRRMLVALQRLDLAFEP